MIYIVYSSRGLLKGFHTEAQAIAYGQATQEPFYIVTDKFKGC